MRTYCIICGKERPGLEIEEDWVIVALRWLKKNVTRNEKGNRLVVCKTCYPEYKKRRAKFRNRKLIYVAVGVLFMVFGLLLSPRLSTFIVMGIMLALLYLLSLANYIPELNAGEARK